MKLHKNLLINTICKIAKENQKNYNLEKANLLNFGSDVFLFDQALNLFDADKTFPNQALNLLDADKTFPIPHPEAKFECLNNPSFDFKKLFEDEQKTIKN